MAKGAKALSETGCLVFLFTRNVCGRERGAKPLRPCFDMDS